MFLVERNVAGSKPGAWSSTSPPFAANVVPGWSSGRTTHRRMKPSSQPPASCRFDSFHVHVPHSRFSPWTKSWHLVGGQRSEWTWRSRKSRWHIKSSRTRMSQTQGGRKDQGGPCRFGVWRLRSGIKGNHVLL